VKRLTISCAEVIQEISNYLEHDVPGKLRARMETHLADCSHCHAVLDGVRNTISLVADGRVFDLPNGFATRLYSKLKTADDD